MESSARNAFLSAWGTTFRAPTRRALSTTPSAVRARERRREQARIRQFTRIAERIAQEQQRAQERAVAAFSRGVAARRIARNVRDRLANRFRILPSTTANPRVEVTSVLGLRRAIAALRPAGSQNVQLTLRSVEQPGLRTITRRVPLDELDELIRGNRRELRLLNRLTQVVIDTEDNVIESFKLDSQGSSNSSVGRYTYSFDFGGAATDYSKDEAIKLQGTSIEAMSYKSKSDNCVLACLNALYGQDAFTSAISHLVSKPVAPVRAYKAIRDHFDLKGPIPAGSARKICEDLGFVPPMFVNGDLLDLVSLADLSRSDILTASQKTAVLVIHRGHCTRFLRFVDYSRCNVCQHDYIDIENHKCDPDQARYKNQFVRKTVPHMLLTYDLETRGNLASRKITYEINERGEAVAPMVAYRQVATCLSFWGLDGDDKMTTHAELETMLDDRIMLGTDCVNRFVEFLVAESQADRHYIIKAHNGSRFDHYFLIEAIQAHPKYASTFGYKDIVTKGSKIIQMQFFGHIIQDSALHTPQSLDEVCKAYKVETKKIKELDGVKTMDICLTRPTLGPNEFLESLNDFELRVYRLYCLIDSVSLYQACKKYDITMALLIAKTIWPGENAESVASALNKPPIVITGDENSRRNNGLKKLAKKVNVVKKILSAPTAPGIIKRINKKVNAAHIKNGDIWMPSDEAFAFFKAAIIGGISHVQHPGCHKKVGSLDVKSEYPACMMRHPEHDGPWQFQPTFPKGAPIKTTEWVKGKLGIYRIIDVKCAQNIHIGCIPGRGADNRLDWSLMEFESSHVTSVDLENMEAKGYNFTVTNGYYWEESFNPFEQIMAVFRDEKMRQDVLKDTKPEEYNEVLRTGAKLCMNSFYGALLDRGDNMSIEDITDDPNADITEGTRIVCNDRILLKKSAQKKANNPIQMGVFILGYSRRLIQGYMDIIGRENVIATETDSIYTTLSCVEMIKQSTHPVLRVGDAFGNMDVEHKLLVDFMTLGKKCYSALKPIDGAPKQDGLYIHNDRTGTIIKNLEDKKSLMRFSTGDEVVDDKVVYLHKKAFKGVSNPRREYFKELIENRVLQTKSTRFYKTLFQHKQRTGISIGQISKITRADKKLTFAYYDENLKIKN